MNGDITLEARCLQDQYRNNKTRPSRKQRHLADLTFKQVNATVDLHSSDVPSRKQKLN